MSKHRASIGWGRRGAPLWGNRLRAATSHSRADARFNGPQAQTRKARGLAV